MISTPLVIVSNRQPYRHEYAGEASEEVVVDQPGGGVVAALDGVARRLGATWVAWGDGEADEEVVDGADRVAVPPEDPAYTLDRVWLSDAEVHGYYEGYANRVLWPLCHGAMGAFAYRAAYWERYQNVNRRFAERVRQTADDDATVWFHDYHLALAPALVRDDIDGPIVQFWHIPWPPVEIYRYCPERRDLLEGLLACDLLGFHVNGYLERFLDCVEAFVPEARIDRRAGTVRLDGHETQLAAFPIGVDVDEISTTARKAGDVEAHLRERYDIGGQILLGVDRLDYTKGIPERLAAYEHLLETSPRHCGTVTYVQKSIPSRESIPEYQELQESVERRTSAINARFATDDWQPVVTIREFLPKETLHGLYRAADVMVVTPLCDGMNLVSQEYVAAQVSPDAALVLSEFAGSHEFLAEAAITVNPYDTPGHAAAIEHAIDMGVGERMRRVRRLRSAVDSLDIQSWAPAILAQAERVNGRSRTPGIE